MPEYVQWALVGAGLLFLMWLATDPADEDAEAEQDGPRPRRRRAFRHWRPRRSLPPAQRGKQLARRRRQTDSMASASETEEAKRG